MGGGANENCCSNLIARASERQGLCNDAVAKAYRLLHTCHHLVSYAFFGLSVVSTMIRAPLKTKKFKADETEKAELPVGNEHFEVEVKRRNSKFLEVPYCYYI
jgi:hypothetical protein